MITDPHGPHYTSEPPANEEREESGQEAYGVTTKNDVDARGNQRMEDDVAVVAPTPGKRRLKKKIKTASSPSPILNRVRRFSPPILLTLFAWACLTFICGPAAAYGSNLFALSLLFVAASCASWFVATFTPHIPAFIGALFIGILLRNIPPRIGDAIDPRWASVIRSFALVIILSRAGLGLDLSVVWKRWKTLCVLTVLPNLAEGALAAGCAKAFYPELPLVWALQIGFLLFAVSPAVVVPGCMALQEEGYGITSGITTVIIAATALGDVLSIVGFSICISLVFASTTSEKGGEKWWIVLLLFLAQIVTAAVGGWGVGLGFAHLFPSMLPLETGVISAQNRGEEKDKEAEENGSDRSSSMRHLQPRDGYAEDGNTDEEEGENRSASREGALVPTIPFIISPITRFGLFLGCSMFAVFGSTMKQIEWSIFGSLFVLIFSLTVAHSWAPSDVAALGQKLVIVWNVAVSPLLFGTIGAALDIGSMTPHDVGTAAAIIFSALLLRFLVTLSIGCPFSLKERSFLALSQMPKATVQAALARVPLDKATLLNGETNTNIQKEEFQAYGKIVAMVGILSIIFTAPPGGVLVSIAGRRLLSLDCEKSRTKRGDIRV